MGKYLCYLYSFSVSWAPLCGVHVFTQKPLGKHSWVCQGHQGAGYQVDEGGHSSCVSRKSILALWSTYPS